MNEAKISISMRLRAFVLSVRWILLLGALAMFLATLSSCATSGGSSGRKIPVIFDTDICDDIDDTWALAMLLQSPEFDVKLITTAVRNTPSKAKVVARFLETVGRTDIPIGIGVQHNEDRHRQQAWIEDYELSSYPGKIYEDGVQALIDTIMKSRRKIKLVAVGPLPNIAAALEREPKIAEKAEFVGMQRIAKGLYSAVEYDNYAARYVRHRSA